jgi:hypothetical protein
MRKSPAMRRQAPLSRPADKPLRSAGSADPTSNGAGRLFSGADAVQIMNLRAHDAACGRL